jgi:uncharacterized membrane protein YbhN (UPF0104 family)
VLRLLVSLLLIAVVLWRASPHTVVASFSHVKPWWFGAALAVALLQTLVNALQWNSLLRSAGERLPLLGLVRAQFIAVAWNQILPTSTGGDVARAVIAGRSGVSGGAAGGTVVLTRMLGFVGLSLVGIGGAALATDAPRIYRLMGLVVSGGVLVAGIGIVAVARTRLGTRLLTAGGQTTGWRRHLAPAIVLMRGNRAMAVGAGWGVVFWLLSVLNIELVSWALDIRVSPATMAVSLSVASVATMMPLAINGIGIREAAFGYLFTMINRGAALGIALALLLEVQSLALAVIGAMLLLTRAPGSEEQKARRASIPLMLDVTHPVAQVIVGPEVVPVVAKSKAVSSDRRADPHDPAGAFVGGS